MEKGEFHQLKSGLVVRVRRSYAFDEVLVDALMSYTSIVAEGVLPSSLDANTQMESFNDSTKVRLLIAKKLLTKKSRCK